MKNIEEQIVDHRTETALDMEEGVSKVQKSAFFDL